MAGSNVAIKGVEIIVGILFFIGIIMWILKFTGLDNVIDAMKPGGGMSTFLKFGAAAYGANFVYKKARAAGFKPPTGKATKAYFDESLKLSKELKGKAKIKFDKAFKSEVKEIAQTKDGKALLATEEGALLMKEETLIAEAVVEAGELKNLATAGRDVVELGEVLEVVKHM